MCAGWTLGEQARQHEFSHLREHFGNERMLLDLEQLCNRSTNGSEAKCAVTRPNNGRESRADGYGTSESRPLT